MEKRSVAHLEAAGLDADAAVSLIPKIWSDRIKPVGAPLFPGYVFAHFSLTEIARALASPGVIGVVRREGIPVPIRPEEILAVRRLTGGITSTGTPSEEENYDLVRGVPIIVVTGPFEGLHGVLMEKRGGRQIAICIDAIRQARSVTLDRSAIRIISRDEQASAPLRSESASS